MQKPGRWELKRWKRTRQSQDFDFNTSRDDVVDLAFLYSNFHYFNFVVCRG